MMADEGLDTLDDLADEIIGRTENSMRRAIDRIPGRTLSLPQESSKAPASVTISISALTVNVDGSDILVDFDGTSPQVDWGVNVVYNFTYAYVFMADQKRL